MEGQAPITILLAVLCTLLFYRWVDRKHKVILAKAVGTIALVLIAVGAIQALRQARNRKIATQQKFEGFLREIRALKVAYLPESTYHDSIPGRNRRAYPDHIAFRVCNAASDTVDAFSIDANTWSKGHSERVSVISQAPFPWDKPVSLKSDVVLAPTACTVAAFWGYFIIRDSVVATAEPQFRHP